MSRSALLLVAAVFATGLAVGRNTVTPRLPSAHAHALDKVTDSRPRELSAKRGPAAAESSTCTTLVRHVNAPLPVVELHDDRPESSPDESADQLDAPSADELASERESFTEQLAELELDLELMSQESSDVTADEHESVLEDIEREIELVEIELARLRYLERVSDRG